jgi:2-hydroxychromene-2-carboxylate isomerase
MSEAGQGGVCLVIGAGDGLGASVARAFTREGLRVCVTRRPRHTEAVDKLAQTISAEGGDAYAFGLDARVESDVAALVDRIEREIGAIEVLVFNIGANVRFPIVETTTRVYSKVWEMAALAGFLASREVARGMIERGRGTILFTGATASVRGGGGLLRLRRGEARAQGARAESGARTGAEGDSRRPYRHRRRDRRRLHPLHHAGRRRAAGAGADSRSRRNRQQLCLAPSPEAQRVDVRDGLAAVVGNLVMSATIEFIFDFGSPNAYLGYRALPPILERTGARLMIKPCLLGGIFKATGNQAPTVAFAGVKGKLEYDMLEIRRFVAKHRFDQFRLNPHFPVNTLMLMRGLIAAREAGQEPAYLEMGLKGLWEEGLKLDDPEVLARRIDSAGLNAAGLLAAAQTDRVKLKLAANTAAAVARGVFGIPTFFVGDEMFFGKDRLGQVEETIEARAA